MELSFTFVFLCFKHVYQSSRHVLDLVTLIKPAFASFVCNSAGISVSRLTTAPSGTIVPFFR